MEFRKYIEATENPYGSKSVELSNILGSAASIASNSYRRTRHFREYPVDLMAKWIKYMHGIKSWIQRFGLEMKFTNLDLAISSLGDALLDFRRNGGMLTPATHKTPDPSMAETLPQFAKFLDRRVRQPPVPGKELAEFASHYDAFLQELTFAAQKWRSENPTDDESE